MTPDDVAELRPAVAPEHDDAPAAGARIVARSGETPRRLVGAGLEVPGGLQPMIVGWLAP